MPRGHALGMVSQVPEKDEYSTTKQQMMARIDVCMGGKAAEELIFGGLSLPWLAFLLASLAFVTRSSLLVSLVQGLARRTHLMAPVSPA